MATQIYLIYAKNYLIPSGIISLLTYSILIVQGTSTLSVLFWLKLITSPIFLVDHSRRKQQELFFYLNMGIGGRRLNGVAILIDYAIWLVGMITLINLLS
ncbi:MAG: hypothetical protein AAF960_29845 [Bacteroidota bacterium]